MNPSSYAKIHCEMSSPSTKELKLLSSIILIWTKINEVKQLNFNLLECRYIESKPKYWSPKHTVIFKAIENMDKMKLVLCVQHTMNHQNYGEKSARRSELVFELKKIFETLNIKYHLLPQEVHLTQVNIPNGRMVL